MRLSLRARTSWLFVATVFTAGLSLTAVVYLYLRLTPVPVQAVIEGVGGVPGSDGAFIDGSVPISHEVLNVMLGASLVALCVLTALAGAIGWFVAGVLLKPVRTIAATARLVSAGDLDQRFDYEGPADDVADLAHALDSMLESLAHSIAARQRFASNASHELKTPIATIQTIADVALLDPNAPAEELRDAIRDIRTVNASSAEMVTSLLNFSQAEAKVLEARDIDISELITTVASSAEGIDATIEPDIHVLGDVVLLRHAIQNLIENARIHGVDGTVQVRVCRTGSGDGVEVGVVNDGDVLDPATVSQLVEPFSRANARVAGARPGHGLGLALVDTIARAHHGELELEARSAEVGGGLVARMTLPVANRKITAGWRTVGKQ
ncbi:MULTISPECIES: HAMP domain-containing sensor histidine kinase [unclassified Corynebacterium]|uniref:HAMP domain-containing sensor histidine kinase n=1 Tax=unclassified Corynebacterium TaxID=2624378 RepID=UPI0008A1BEB8|nr:MULTISPECIES: HAMP domain-containing sensor histidine kinase [unclassified Corynebacterium]MCQ4611987.1 HAMP domain-containing histidine kinase [Corynebacterium sp. CCUG 51687]OFT28315.1 hypothetical protein HMPREF3170_10170 [Corynebacterium sp. HMSC08D02]WPJ92734.1 HAMP domain-containing sensor histidine kinase [Corynebacterium sp. UMB2355A]